MALCTFHADKFAFAIAGNILLSIVIDQQTHGIVAMHVRNRGHRNFDSDIRAVIPMNDKKSVPSVVPRTALREYCGFNINISESECLLNAGFNTHN